MKLETQISEIVAAEPSHHPPILSIEFSLEFGSNSMVFSVDSVRILAFFDLFARKIDKKGGGRTKRVLTSKMGGKV